MTFRDGLLEGRRVAVAGAGSGAAGTVDGLRGLGAWVGVIDPETLADEAAAAGWAQRRGPLDGLVFLADEPFGPGGADRLEATLELAWRAALGAQLHASGRGGRLLFVGPCAQAGAHAEAAQAGLENLARTLSVEWARFAVTATAIAPGPAADAGVVADLVAYLLSDAGGYFSGCRFTLGAHPVS